MTSTSKHSPVSTHLSLAGAFNCHRQPDSSSTLRGDGEVGGLAGYAGGQASAIGSDVSSRDLVYMELQRRTYFKKFVNL